MKLEPVKTHKTNYPDKYQVDLNRLLITHKPNRWKKSQAAALLLCALTASKLTGCDNALQRIESKSTLRKMNMAPIFEGSSNPANSPTTASGMSFQKQKVNFIPLGNYPMYPSLTEESALAIIKDELQKHGLSSESSKKKVEIADDKINVSEWSFDLNMSGAKEAVYVEFIPSIDAETKNELSERKALNLPDAPKDAAAKLREELCEVQDESTGVIFYTNQYTFDPSQNLRDQVDEFVIWLKTTGLI